MRRVARKLSGDVSAVTLGVRVSLARNDDNVSVQRVSHRNDRREFWIAGYGQQPPHTGRVLVDHPRQPSLCVAMPGAQLVELRDDLINRRNRMLLALKLSPELRILGQALRKTPIVMTGIK